MTRAFDSRAILGHGIVYILNCSTTGLLIDAAGKMTKGERAGESREGQSMNK